MDQNEIARVQGFVDNTAQFEAVKKAIMLELSGGQEWARRMPRNIPNEQYGEYVKIIAEALDQVEQGFDKLHAYSKPATSSDEVNEAR